MFFNENRTHNYEEDNASTKDRLQRLGYPTGYGSLNVCTSYLLVTVNLKFKFHIM